MKSKKIKLGLHYDMPDSAYHAQQDPKDHFYSSSQLKDILKSPALFKKKYITREVETGGTNSAFSVGTYVHTAILEPENLESTTAIYKGAQRRGKEWEAFNKEHEGKVILVHDEKKASAGAMTELLTAQHCIDVVDDSDWAQRLLHTGTPEVSLFVELEGIRIKVRADWLKLAEGAIVDLKTTSSDPASPSSMLKSTKDYSYDLSAALYMDAFNKYCAEGKGEEGGYVIDKFYWIYAGKKKDDGCQCYEASEKMMELGRKKYKEAIRLIKYYESLDWEIPEEILVLNPASWEVSDWESVGKPSDIKKKVETKKKIEPAKPAKTKRRRML